MNKTKMWGKGKSVKNWHLRDLNPGLITQQATWLLIRSSDQCIVVSSFTHQKNQ